MRQTRNLASNACFESFVLVLWRASHQLDALLAAEYSLAFTAASIVPAMHTFNTRMSKTWQHCLLLQTTVCCCWLVVCAELEWERFLTTFKMLDGFFGRGLLQAFEALLTLELTLQHGIKEGTSDFHKSLQLYRGVAGVSLLVCSGFYILGGLLCFGRMRKGRLTLIELMCSFVCATLALCVKLHELLCLGFFAVLLGF